MTIHEYLGASAAIFLSIVIVAAILRQRTGKTFQKMLLVSAAILLSAAVASNIAINILVRPVSLESFIILSKRVQATFDILFALAIGAFLVVTSKPEINSVKDFRRYMIDDFPNSYVVYTFIMALGLFSVLTTTATVQFTAEGGYVILFPPWFVVTMTIIVSTIMIYIPYNLLGYLRKVKPPRAIVHDTHFIILGLEGYTATEFLTEIAFPNLGYDVRVVGFLVEVLLIALVALAVRERRFLQDLLAPVPEAHLDTARSFHLEEGFSYIVPESEPSHSFEVFKDVVTHGVRGLCITRQQPDKVAQAYGLERTPILWLSRVVSNPNCVRPTPPENVAMAIDHFLEVSPKSVVLLDGVEYLVAHNEFSSVLTLLHDLNERVSVSDSILLLPLDPKAFDEREFTLLKRDLRMLEAGVSSAADSRVELSPGPSLG
ncbi:MAG: DUF835 domain-containing protein [Thermoplasmata archaeon]